MQIQIRTLISVSLTSASQKKWGANLIIDLFGPEKGFTLAKQKEVRDLVRKYDHHHLDFSDYSAFTEHLFIEAQSVIPELTGLEVEVDSTLKFRLKAGVRIGSRVHNPT